MADLLFDYARRDPQDILAQLKQQLTEFTGQVWDDFSENDIGYALIKAHVELSDFNSFYVDAQVAENFLSLCQLRESAIRAAKMLNYIPTQANPAEVSVRLTHPGFNTSLVIPANTLWTIDAKTFICQSPISIPQGQTQTDISLVQGTSYELEQTSNGDSFYSILIPTNSSLIEVRVNSVLWSPVDSFIGIGTDKRVYKIYEDVQGQVIMFEANINAFKPSLGDTVRVNAVLTEGSKGNILESGITVSSISVIRDEDDNDITNAFTGVTITAAVGGTDVESTDSIRVNAPKFYSTQGRLVTASDYEAFILKNVDVKDVIVIGGEQVNDYGKVFIIVYPKPPAFQAPNYLVSQDFLDSVRDSVRDLNIITITVIVQTPDPVEITVTGTVGANTQVFNEFATPTNLSVNEATTFFDNLKIGQSVYMSELTAPITSLTGIDYVNLQLTCKGIAVSQAGLVDIQLIKNHDVTDCQLLDEDDNILFEGDATQYVTVTGRLKFEALSLVSEDKMCILKYKGTGSNLLLTSSQVAILEQLELTSELIQQ